MADNVDVTEGSGKTIKTEDEGGVQYQVVKLAASGSGTTEALSKAEDSAHAPGNHGITALTVRQDTAAALSGTDADYQPLITDANGRLHVLDQNSAAILTALQIIDDWDDGNYCNVNINVAGTDVSSNAGTLDAQTIRVTIATDDECNNLLGTIDADTGAIKTAVELIDNAISGSEMQVDIVADGAGLATDAKLDTIITALQIMDDWDDSDKCNVNMNIAGTDVSANSGTLDAQTLRVTIATDDECNNLLGTIDADTSNIVTAVQLIDDAIYADDADWSDGSSKHALVGGLYQSSPQTVTDGDVAPFQVDVNGCLVLGTGAKAIGKLAANTGVDIGDVDVTSIVPGVGATNLGKAEDAGHSSGDVGVMAMTVRQNTAAALSGTDADYQPLITDTNGRLHVLDQNSAAILTALQIIDDWDDGDYCNVNLNLAGADASANEGTIDATTLRVTIATDDDGVAHLATIAGDTTSVDGKITACNTGAVVLATGSAAIGKLAANTGVDIGDVDVTSIVPGTAATNLGKAEDAGHSSGDVGVMAMSVRQNTAASLSGTDADYQPLITDTNGRLHVISSARAKAVEAITDWTAVAQNAVGESGTIDCSGHDGTSLLIQAFLDTTTAHTGTKFKIQVSSNTTGNEDWHDYREFVALIGTAATDLIEDNPLAAGSTSLTLTGHSLTTEAIWIGIENGTLVNSELIFVASQSANAVVALDPTTNAHVQNTAVFNVAISKVVILDASVNRARIIVDNTYDDNGSTLNYKVRAAKLTR